MVDETKVNFSLWTVLGFLVLLFGLCFSYLFVSQANSKEDRIKSDQAQCDRITRMETQYVFILEGQQRIEAKLDRYNNEVKNKRTNISDLRWK
jgi:cell division protein FtsB